MLDTIAKDPLFKGKMWLWNAESYVRFLLHVMKISIENFMPPLKKKDALTQRSRSKQACFTKFLKGQKRRKNLIHKYIHSSSWSNSYSRNRFDRREDQAQFSQKYSFSTQHFNFSSLQQQRCNSWHKIKHNLKWYNCE